MSSDHAALDASDNGQRRVLLQVLLLNAGLSVVLLIGGLLSDSSSLLANALDNMSDALAYTGSYFAVSKSDKWKRVAAGVTGVMLFVLAIGVILDATRRFVVGSQPLGPAMISLAIVATITNAWSIWLLKKFRQSDVNLRAAWTMSVNDFASNLGIFFAGGLVWFLGSNWPDLAVAIGVALVATYGGVKTLRDVLKQQPT